MGISGFSVQSNFLENFNEKVYFIDACRDCLYHGTEWIYTFVETFFAYDYRIIFYKFLNILVDDSFDYFFQSLWYLNINYGVFNLFWAVMLDQYIINNFFKFYCNADWYKNILQSKELTLVFLYHPEMLFFNFKNITNQYFETYSYIIITILDSTTTSSDVSCIFLFMQFLLVFYFSIMFVVFYFSYFTSMTKEESTIDSDYLIANLLVESEKEIGSMDDMLMVLFFLLFIFGWYFYIYFLSILSTFPEIVLVFYSLPFLYYVIISMPTYLVYDFGIYFLTYLRGVGSSSLFTMELLYDYIAFAAFYIRLMVQSVRLILMTFTYISLHDLILFFDFNSKLFLGFESLTEDLTNVSGTFNSFSYFFFLLIPLKVLYWLYEVLHTYFVVTAQFVAFFAMVFWLYLFLYTFFVLEKQENYFKDKRKLKKELLKHLSELKEVN